MRRTGGFRVDDAGRSTATVRSPTRVTCGATEPPPPVENATARGETSAVQSTMERYSRHVLVCTGGYCSPNRGGRELYALLPELLERENLLFGPNRVKRGETPCLGVCAGGPIVVVYPEGVWYSGVTPQLLDRIVREHLREGRVVEDAVFFRL